MSVSRDSTTNLWTVQYRFTDWTGKRKHTTRRGFKTKKEALEWEAKIKLDCVVDPDIAVKDFTEVYFRDKSGELKERTLRMKKYMIDTHIVPHLGKKKMNEIAPADIIKWQKLIRSKGYSDSYLRMVQNQLSGLFNHACTIYGLSNNPCKKVKKMGNSNIRRLDFWTYEEYEKFLSAIDKNDKYYVIFEVLFWTGMRIGEMLALTSNDIHLESNRIEINKTYFRMDRRDIITAPKTESSARTVDIPQFLAEELKNYMDAQYALPGNERLFPIVAEAVQHKLKAVCKKTGVKKIPVHGLRHSAVAYLISQGVPPLVIKERMGHANIKITLDTYGHLYPNQQRQVADMLDAKRKGPDSWNYQDQITGNNLLPLSQI